MLAWLGVDTWDRVPCITRKSGTRVLCGFHTRSLGSAGVLRDRSVLCLGGSQTGSEEDPGAAGRCPGQSPGHLAGLGGNLLPGQPSCHRQHWGVCAPAQWMGLRVTSVCRWSVRSNGLKTPGRRSVFHAEVATRGRCAGNAACRFTQSPSDFALGGLRGALSGVALRLQWGRRPARRCFGLRVAA